MRKSVLALVAVTVGLSACAVEREADDSPDSAATDATDALVLGPADGRDLPGVDLERVQVGDLAPDFSLASLGGPVVSLSPVPR